jgi:hypothetical protein
MVLTSPTNPIIYIDDFATANFAPPYNNWTPIVAAAIASFDHLEDNINLSDSPGGTIVFGPSPGRVPITNGTYNFLTPALPNVPQGFGIELNRGVTLVGAGGVSGNATCRTRLSFAAGLGGIRANAKGYPINSNGQPSGLLGADGFLIENLYIIGSGAGSGPPTADGVYFSCGGKITGCSVAQFPGHGVHAHGNPGDKPPTGCDLSTIAFTDVDANGGDGIHIEGHDANGIMVLQCTHRQNNYGIYDNSLTGAHIIGGQFEANVIDVWANTPSAITTLVSCYKESGERVTICGNAVVVGGVLAADLLGNPSINTPDAVGGMPTVIGGAGLISWFRANAMTKTGGAQIGNPTAGSDYFFQLTDFRESGGAWPFRAKSYTTGGVGFDYGASGVPFFTFLNSRNLKANGYPIDAAKIPDFNLGGVAMRGVVLGPSNAMIFQGVASAKPTSTSYPIGSVIHNASAVNIGDPTMWKLVNRSGMLQWVVAGTLQS